MAKSFKSTRNLTGGGYKQKLYFVPCADYEPKVGHEISESAFFRILLNEERMKKSDEAAEVKMPEMLDVFKDIDKHSKITQVEAYRSSMNPVTDAVKAYHVFIVFKSTSETADDRVYYWWSLEKNTDYIVLQRSRNKENVKDKLEGEERNKVKLIEKDLEGKGTIKDLFEILWTHQMIPEKYHIKKSNCQSLVTFVGQQITNIGYKYKGNFKYYPPSEKGRDKKMLELINVIRGCSDWPPLFHLIIMGSTDLVDKTVASGQYDINALYNGLTPLHLAIKWRKTKMVKHLLQNPMNADPTKRDASGKNALLLAASMFEINAEIIDLLLEHDKVNVDDVDGKGQTALYWAVYHYNVSADRPHRSNKVIAVQKFLEKGANPNITDKWGRSPLHLAVKRNGNKIIDLLLAHGKVMIDHADGKGRTALQWAARETNVVAVQKLLEKGANPNIVDKKGRSPLHLRAAAQKNGNEICLDLLLTHSKVKVDDENGKGRNALRNALHNAASASNVMVVKYLINKGANPNAVDKSGDSPLLVAARQRKGNPIIDLLLEAQKVKGMGDVNDRNKKGRTALHYAAAYSNEINAKHLIKKGANVNCRANVGDTPLHYAALGAKKMKIIDLLLENISEGDIQQYRNDKRLFLFARHNVHGLGNTIVDRLVQKSIIPPCTETDDCITAESDEATASRDNTRRFVLDKGADPPIDLTGFDGLDFLIARVKISLGIYGDINGRDKYGKTLLLVAILGNNVDWVRNLLENGADPTIRDKYGYTPFHVAVENCRSFDILNLLLESGKVDINETTKYEIWTALHLAIIKSSSATAEFLLLKGANTNTADQSGSTPLHWAASRPKDMDIFELLLNHPDVDVNLMDNKGRNALDRVTFNNHGHGERIANLLKDKGAVEIENRLPKRNKEFLVTLRYCISSDAADEIENLLSDATVPNEDIIARIKEEHLYTAIYDSDVERVRRLLKNGADISSVRGKNGSNALHVASLKAKTTDLIDVILETEKFDINGVNNRGWTPLHLATDRDINARHLIRKGADPNIADEEGNTPLHFAARYAKEIETISLLLENKQVDINHRGNNGWTALHHAIEASNVITVGYLLKKDADPDAADGNGATPLHLAVKDDYYYNTTKIIDIILETEKCNINGVDNYGRTPLHYAVETRPYPNTIHVCRLIKMGADPGIADKNGVTPLHMAARNAESMDLIEVLLNTEAVDVNCVDNQGRTPLACARDNKHGLGQRIVGRLKEFDETE
jgi:ankyrin repeat protein